MTDASKPTPTVPRPAATLLLLREGRGAGLEVLMIARTPKDDFAGGALIFPGGKVDATDRWPNWRARSFGGTDFEDEELALRIAAIRETFEEVGVLLACGEASGVFPEAEILHDIAEGLESERESAEALHAALEARQLALACGKLVRFCHWITPEPSKKRYDTHFYVSEAPDRHRVIADGSEAESALWINPGEALKEGDAGNIQLMFPTRLNLEVLSKASSVEEAMAVAERHPIVPVCPTVRVNEGKRVLEIPIEAGYGITEMAVEKLPPMERKF